MPAERGNRIRRAVCRHGRLPSRTFERPQGRNAGVGTSVCLFRKIERNHARSNSDRPSGAGRLGPARGLGRRRVRRRHQPRRRRRRSASITPCRPAPAPTSAISTPCESAGVVRVLTVYNKTNFFIDQGTAQGVTVDAFRLFEDYLNQKYNTGNLKIHVALVPVRRENIAAALLEGRGDIAAANLTVTPERLQKADFSNPTLKKVSEIVVGAPDAAPICERRPSVGQAGLRPQGVDLRREPRRLEHRPHPPRQTARPSSLRSRISRTRTSSR